MACGGVRGRGGRGGLVATRGVGQAARGAQHPLARHLWLSPTPNTQCCGDLAPAHELDAHRSVHVPERRSSTMRRLMTSTCTCTCRASVGRAGSAGTRLAVNAAPGPRGWETSRASVPACSCRAPSPSSSCPCPPSTRPCSAALARAARRSWASVAEGEVVRGRYTLYAELLR